MATKYFKKINLQNTLTDAGNVVIQFEPTADRNGVISVEDSNPLLPVLQKYADDRVGGVVEISAEIYDQLKKKELELKPSHPLFSGQTLRAARQPDPLSKREESVVSVVGANQSTPKPTDHLPPSRSSFLARTRRAAEAAKT